MTQHYSWKSDRVKDNDMLDHPNLLQIILDNKKQCAKQLVPLLKHYMTDAGFLYRVAQFCEQYQLNLHPPYVVSDASPLNLETPAEYDQLIEFLTTIDNDITDHAPKCVNCTYYYQLRMEIFRIAILVLRVQIKEKRGEVDTLHSLPLSGKHSPIIKDALEELLGSECFYVGASIGGLTRLAIESLDATILGVSEHAVRDFLGLD